MDGDGEERWGEGRSRGAGGGISDRQREGPIRTWKIPCCFLTLMRSPVIHGEQAPIGTRDGANNHLSHTHTHTHTHTHRCGFEVSLLGLVWEMEIPHAVLIG